MKKDLRHITTWLETYKLSLNIDKTKTILFHPPKRKLENNEKSLNLSLALIS